MQKTFLLPGCRFLTRKIYAVKFDKYSSFEKKLVKSLRLRVIHLISTCSFGNGNGKGNRNRTEEKTYFHSIRTGIEKGRGEAGKQLLLKTSALKGTQA